MRKKVVSICVVMLLMFSSVMLIFYHANDSVGASDPVGGGGVGLPYYWVWNRTIDFANVIHDVNWSEGGGNGIPKGRAWATAGENYTILHILWEHMGKPEFACGLTNYTNLTIGYIEGEHGLEPNTTNKPKQYSSKIVIQNYGLNITNNSSPYCTIPYSEMFPLGIGALPRLNNNSNGTFNFTNAKPILKDLNVWEYIQDHFNITADLLNENEPFAGLLVHLHAEDTVPGEQDGLVFIMDEEQSCEDKLENITSAAGCILLNPSRGYLFENSSSIPCSMVRINGTYANLTEMLQEIDDGSNYTVDNVDQLTTMVFSNYSNLSCFSLEDWVAVVQREAPSETGNPYYDFTKLVTRSYFWRFWPFCQGAILSDFNYSTHFMTYSMRDWWWFPTGVYTNRWPLPIFSVNRSIGQYLINNSDTARVSGFIEQEYRQQTNTTPGVISHNVVEYQNST